MDAASPPADSPVFDLPPEFAAALDAPGGLRVRDPRTGAKFQLVPSPAPGLNDGEPDAEPFDGYRSGETLEESVLAGIADADAGRTLSLEEARQEMERRHPELRGR